MGKESTIILGDAGFSGSVLGSGRCPGRGNGNPLQYSCLKNPMDRRAWQAKRSHRGRHCWVTKHRIIIITTATCLEINIVSFWETCDILKLFMISLFLLWWPPDVTGKTCVISSWEGKNVFPPCGPLQALTYLHWRCHLLDGSVDIFQQKLQQFCLYELVYGFWKTQLFPLCWAPWNSTKSSLARF